MEELSGRFVTSHSGTHPSCQMMKFAAAMTMMLTGSISEQEPAFQLHQPQPQPRHLLLLMMLPLAPPPAQTLVSQISQTCPPWQSTHDSSFKCDYVPTSHPTVLESLLISWSWAPYISTRPSQIGMMMNFMYTYTKTIKEADTHNWANNFLCS